MSEETDNRVMECLGMADEASRKADAASFAGDARFWRRMEQRWLRLAQTYRATDAMTAAWLRAAPQPARHPNLENVPGIRNRQAPNPGARQHRQAHDACSAPVIPDALA